MRLKDTGLTAQELKDMVNKYMVETYERYDFIAERAEGMYLYDEEGNAYLDFYGGVAVNSCGNRNPKVIAAIKDQLDDIMHTFNHTRFRRHYWLRKYVIRLEWIRSFIRTPELKQMNV